MRRMEHTTGSRVADLMRLVSMLLLSVLTALAVVSCGGSGDEPGGGPSPVPNEPMPIVFSGSLSEGESESHARTRATTNPLSATHQAFHVWAYKNPASGSTETVMRDYTVNYVSGSAGTTTSNSSGWEYVNQGTQQSIKYWDFKAEDYRFFAWAGSGVTTSYSSSEDADHPCVRLSFPVDVSSTISPSSATPYLRQDPVTLSMTSTTPLYSKLWYKAKAALPAQKNLPVTLQFLQPYVKVRFLFRQSESAEVVFTLSEMSFKPTSNGNIYIKGSFQVTYPLTGETSETWKVTHASPGTKLTDYLTAFTQHYYEAASDDEDQKKWYVVLPAVDQGPYTLSVKVNNDPRSVVVPAQYMNWQPGYEYTYVFKITDPGGVELDGVQVGFSPWTEISGKTKDIFNW